MKVLAMCFGRQRIFLCLDQFYCSHFAQKRWIRKVRRIISRMENWANISEHPVTHLWQKYLILFSLYYNSFNVRICCFLIESRTWMKT